MWNNFRMRIACNFLKYSDAPFDNSGTARTHRSCNDSGTESLSAKLEILQDPDFPMSQPEIWSPKEKTNDAIHRCTSRYKMTRCRDLVGLTESQTERGRKSLDVVFISPLKHSLIHKARTYKITLTRSDRQIAFSCSKWFHYCSAVSLAFRSR